MSIHKYNRSSHISNGLVHTQLTGEHVFCSKQKFTAGSHNSDPLCDITMVIFICNTIVYLLSKLSQSLFIPYNIFLKYTTNYRIKYLKIHNNKIAIWRRFLSCKNKVNTQTNTKSFWQVEICWQSNSRLKQIII